MTANIDRICDVPLPSRRIYPQGLQSERVFEVAVHVRLASFGQSHVSGS